MPSGHVIETVSGGSPHAALVGRAEIMALRDARVAEPDIVLSVAMVGWANRLTHTLRDTLAEET